MSCVGILEDIFSAAFWGDEAPKVPDWEEWIHIPMGLTHCEICLKLDRCWFVEENRPILSQHPRCHCTSVPLLFSRVLKEATSGCMLSKIDPYLFDPKGEYKHQKGKMFESWGYSVADAGWLQKEFEKQALEKYVAGEYTLGKLDKQGQRVSIRVEIPRKDRAGKVSFITGWMVEPDGHIRLNTPYGGK